MRDLLQCQQLLLMVELGAQIYFWGRVAYVPLYAFGVRQVRSLVWLVATAGLIMVAIRILV